MVSLFVPTGILEDQEIFKTIHYILKIIKDEELFVTLVVTRADAVLKPHLLQSKISEEFKLNVSNYTKSCEKEFLIDKMTLYVISQMIDDCGAYIKNHLAKFAKRFESTPFPLPAPPVVYPSSAHSHQQPFDEVSKRFADLHVSPTCPSLLIPLGMNQFSQNSDESLSN